MDYKRDHQRFGWIRRFKASFRPETERLPNLEDAGTGIQKKGFSPLDNPVNNFYRQKLTTGLSTFYRFALQSRSLTVRDTFAKAASSGRESLGDLLAVLENLSPHFDSETDLASLQELYDSRILLALADLLANSARSEADTQAALQLYKFVLHVYGDETFEDHNRLQYIEALSEVESYTELNRLCQHFNIEDIAPLQWDLLEIQKIRRTSSDIAWLNALNALYTRLNMASVRLANTADLPLMDRLRSNTRRITKGPKVSILMPTFCPGPGIRTAVRSVLDQTWQDFELIIIDDASPVRYQHVLAELENIDPRIRIIRLSENGGAYVARNAGLAEATGEYVTTHDDDDWSHPEKIECQATELLNDSELIGTTSAHIRATPSLEFRRMNIHAKYMQMNYSSLMFRRNIVDVIGDWDSVNRGGDSELITRIIENFGSDKLKRLLDKPLSFSRVWTGSLTSGEMSRGYFANSRLLYRWAFRQWHWDSKKMGKQAIHFSGETRPYPVPTTFESGHRNADLGVFDVIYVTDFFRQAKFVPSVLKEITALAERGLRVGYMHLHSPQTQRYAGIPQELFQLQLNGDVTQVSHDDVADTRLLIVYDAAIGMFLDELQSTVTSDRAIVIHHEVPTLAGGEKRSAAVMTQALSNLNSCFASDFEVVGTTKTDQQRLRGQVPSNRLLPDHLIWNLQVSRKPGSILPPSHTAVIGFHTYGTQYRWPANENLFRAIYVSDNFETRLYGNLAPAQRKFSAESLDKIELIHFEQQSEAEFLRSIDIWVYHPHHRLQDQIWMPVLDAMNAGRVVVLPKRLESLYGSAAVYADVDELDETIVQLTLDQDRYIYHATQGQDFVKEFFSAESFYARFCEVM